MYSTNIIRLRELHDDLLKAQAKETNPQIKNCYDHVLLATERLENELALLDKIRKEKQ